MKKLREDSIVHTLKADGENASAFETCLSISDILNEARELIVNHYALNGAELPVIGQVTFMVGKKKYMLTLVPEIQEIK